MPKENSLWRSTSAAATGGSIFGASAGRSLVRTSRPTSLTTVSKGSSSIPFVATAGRAKTREKQRKARRRRARATWTEHEKRERGDSTWGQES